MATRTLKARVELDGEKQFKQAMSELNQGSKVLASEMNKLQAEYKGNENSIEALTKKGDILQRQLLQQKDKVEALRAEVQRSAEAYGESDKRTQKLITQLNNAEAAEFDLQHAIEDNDNALQGQDDTMRGLGDVVDDLAGKFGITLPDGAKKALNGMQTLSAGTVAAMTAAVAAVAALVEGIKKLNQMTIDAAESIDDLNTRAAQMDISTQMLQQLEYASHFVDVSTDTMANSFKKLNLKIYDAANGNAAAIESFEKLGISIYDQNGQLRDGLDIWMDSLDALGQVEDATIRDGLANEIYGKSFDELKPLIAAGTDALRGYMDQAVETGYVLETDQIQKLQAVDDAHQEYMLTVEASRNQIAAQWAPAVKAAFETFSKLVQTASRTLVDSGLLSNLASIVSSTMSLLETMTHMFDALPNWMNPLKQLSQEFRTLAMIMALIADAVNVIGGLFTLDFNRVNTALGNNMNKTGEMSNLQQLKYNNTSGWVQDSSGKWAANGFSYNATGNDNWRGGLTYVGESGPELVSLPRGSQIYNAQDTRNMAGNATYNITVNGIKELDEVLNWFESRRVRGRMA